MLCFECQKLWFGAASQAGVARECPDCGSRLVPNVPTRPSEVHGARVQ
jgi:DNA-directed RNA polymerase subunit RPC12/RpoP